MGFDLFVAGKSGKVERVEEWEGTGSEYRIVTQPCLILGVLERENEELR